MKIAYVVIASLCLAGCASGPKMEYYYAFADGSNIPLSGPQADKFSADKTVCVGEMSKAQMSGAAPSTRNEFADAYARIERDGQAANVMTGCMAGKGYRFVAKQVGVS